MGIRETTVSKNIHMLIPIIRGKPPLWLMMAIKNYSFKVLDDNIHVVTNADIGLPNHPVPTGGSQKITHIMKEFNPDILIYHASDWLLEPAGLMQIMNTMSDPKTISAGIHPWSKENGSWHQCSDGEKPHAVMYIFAIKNEARRYADKLLSINFNAELWNEAQHLASYNGFEVKPVYCQAWHMGAH